MLLFLPVLQHWGQRVSGQATSTSLPFLLFLFFLLPIVLPPGVIGEEAALEPAEVWQFATVLQETLALLLPFLLPGQPGSFLY
jgi:hypothetical protein